MRVVLAGGGTAGHIEPALALADALRRLDPDIGITCLGTERGLETRLVPARGYELELMPAVPLPAPPHARAAARARPAGGRDQRGRGDHATGSRPTCWSASAATSRPPAYLAARRRGVPIVVHEANPRPGLANRLGARFTDQSSPTFPDTPLAARRVRRHPAAPRDRHARPAVHGRQGALAASAWTPTCRRCWSPAARRARGGSTRRPRGRRRRRCARPGCRCCTSSARRTRVERGAAAGRPAVRRGAVPRPDGPRLRRRRPRAVPGRRACTCRRADRRRAARGLRAAADRQRRAALNAAADRRGGGGLLVDDAELTPEWIVQNAAAVLSRPRRVVAMARRRPGWASARRRRTRRRRSGWPTMVEDARRTREPAMSARAVPATDRPRSLVPTELGRVHFIGDRRRRHVRHRAASCWRAACRSPAATPRTRDLLDRPAGAGRHGATSGTTPPTSGTPTPSWSPPRSATTTRSSSRRGAAGCGCSPGPPRWPRVMAGRRAVAVAGTHGKTTTTSMLTVALQHCGADPSFAIGGELNETGPGRRTTARGDVFVAEADESDGSFLLLDPDVAVVTNVEADHLDNYGDRERGRGSFDALRRARRPRRVPRRLRRRPGRRRGWSPSAARAASTCVTYGVADDADLRVESRSRRDGLGHHVRRVHGRAAAGRAGRPRPAQRAQRRRRPRGRRRARACPSTSCVRASPPSPAPGAGSSSRARPAASGSSTTTPTTRPSSPPTCARPATVAAGRGPGHRGLPAAPLLAAPGSSPTEFGAALGLADEVVVLDVYGAREDPEPGVTGALVADAVPLPAERRRLRAVSGRRSPPWWPRRARPGDLVLTLGAGRRHDDRARAARAAAGRPRRAPRPARRGRREAPAPTTGRRALAVRLAAWPVRAPVGPVRAPLGRRLASSVLARCSRVRGVAGRCGILGLARPGRGPAGRRRGAADRRQAAAPGRHRRGSRDPDRRHRRERRRRSWSSRGWPRTLRSTSWSASRSRSSRSGHGSRVLDRPGWCPRSSGPSRRRRCPCSSRWTPGAGRPAAAAARRPGRAAGRRRREVADGAIGADSAEDDRGCACEGGARCVWGEQRTVRRARRRSSPRCSGDKARRLRRQRARRCRPLRVTVVRITRGRRTGRVAVRHAATRRAGAVS